MRRTKDWQKSLKFELLVESDESDESEIEMMLLSSHGLVDTKGHLKVSRAPPKKQPNKTMDLYVLVLKQ